MIPPLPPSESGTKRPVLIAETDPLDVPMTDDEIIESIRAAEFEEKGSRP
jgi:hypothetical protein